MATTCEYSTPAVERGEERELLRIGTAPGYARTYVRDQLRAWRLGYLIDACELVASEIVTNVVQHGTGIALSIRMERSGRSVLLRVWDANDRAMPEARRPQADDPGGRGLVLVQTLCAEWGVYRVASGGKVVWALLTEGM
jgi:anti-sigma regulatory factor (Ser/Thr protein kinase)